MVKNNKISKTYIKLGNKMMFRSNFSLMGLSRDRTYLPMKADIAESVSTKVVNFIQEKSIDSGISCIHT